MRCAEGCIFEYLLLWYMARALPGVCGEKVMRMDGDGDGERKRDFDKDRD